MCFRLAIMDDEILIRQSIRMKMETPSYSIVFDGDDGQQLIDYLTKNGPMSVDLVMVDIEMPLMNGLDLIAQIKCINPDILFIIISGHDDFKYMQQAIRLGVDDYILKPIIPGNLNEILNKFQTILSQRNDKLKNECIDSLLRHIACNGALKPEKRMLNIFDCFFKSGFRLELILLGNMRSSEWWFGKMEMDGFSFIFPGMPNLLIRILDANINAAGNALYDYPTVTAFLSGKYCDITMINRIIKEGMKILEQNLILGKRIYIDRQNPSIVKGGEVEAWKSRFKSVLNIISKYMEIQNYTSVIKQVRELYKSAYGVQQHCIEESWRKIAFEVYKYFGDEEELTDDSWVKEFDSLDDFVNELTDLMASIFKLNGDTQKYRTGRDILYDIIVYINKNYHENITIMEIADRFFINRSHLSRIFKKETDRTFNEFLTEIRIRKACQLLRENKGNIMEVSFAVGYEDSRYFSQVFRKIMGCTPSEYSQSVGSKQLRGDTGI